MRKLLDLDPNARFAGVSRDKEKLDVAARTGSAAAGSYALREALGEAGWNSLAKAPEKLDRIAELLSFRDDIGSIRKGLAEIGLEPLLLDALVGAAAQGAFTGFSKAAHLSAKAVRAILPGLREGLTYYDACVRADYDPTARAAIPRKSSAGR